MEPRISRLFGKTRDLNRYWQLLIIPILAITAFVSLFITPLTGVFAQSSPTVVERLPAPPPISVSTPASPVEPNPPASLPELPPPPSPSSSNALPSTPNPAPQPSVIREYTFQAPGSSAAPIPVEPTAANGQQNRNIAKRSMIRVEVMGDSQSILAQVKKIEPLAFIQIGKGTIQAGVFPNSTAAQQRIQQLEQQGLSAIISAGSTH